MMFIRTKKKEGRIYYYIVEGIRKKNKVYQKVKRYLGTAENLLSNLMLLDKLLKKKS
jgi:hypothetical protein